jgi:hypothetical protein
MDFEGGVLVGTAPAVFIPLSLSVIVPGVYRTWVEYRVGWLAVGAFPLE